MKATPVHAAEPVVEEKTLIQRLLRWLERASFKPASARSERCEPHWSATADAEQPENPTTTWVHRWPEYVVGASGSRTLVEWVAYNARLIL